MDFEWVTWGRDFAFKPGKPTGVLHSWTLVSAVRYQVPESEKQEALTPIASFTYLDLTISSQKPSEYYSAGRHQHPLAEYLGSLKPTGEVEGGIKKTPNHSKSQHQLLW